MNRFLLLILALAPALIWAQQHKTQNLVIVTMDGMRWQEVFGGADKALMNDKRFTRDSERVAKRFWSDDENLRRKKLFPFFWTTIISHGQLYGDRNKGSNVDNANPFKFSYPGYNEIFTGFPDTAVNSNDKILNKNTNVLEYLGHQDGYHGKVAVFSTWDVFPYILNKWRSGIYVNSDTDSLAFPSQAFQQLNTLERLSAKPTGERLDILTYLSGKEYLEEYKPRVLYISFDETDEYAHEGTYDQYLNSAYAEDGMIADLWKTLQSMPEYKDKTTLLVTCDHGRGDKVKEQWRDHGEKVQDAGHIWIAVMGPDTHAAGEVKTNFTLYQKQIAATLAALLGFNFKPDQGKAEPIAAILEQ
jgi:hypothetical protein